jgi:hypothetical protein
MAKKQVAEDSVLVSTAKAIGRTAGKVAAATGLAHADTPKAARPGKLVKKNKTRLPRKEKKAQRKAASSRV